MRELQQRLGRMFKAPAQRKPDPHRKAREEAKRLAAICGCEIERCGSGMNVWPPKASQGPDPFEGDHYCQTWTEALDMVEHWAKFHTEAA